MDNDFEVVSAKTALRKLVAQLPAELRAALPIDDQGEPQIEIVQALYRHERPPSGEDTWTEIRELTLPEWEEVKAAQRGIYGFTRGLDSFPVFAWGDLKSAREELLRQMRDESAPDEWMMPLIEYRILNYSTALKLYHEHVCAQMNRTGDKGLRLLVDKEFSELYDRCFAYRLIYSMRNAFQHGVRGLVSLRMTARLAKGSDTEVESEIHAYLAKDVFTHSRANAAVRSQVSENNDEIDLLKLSEESFREVQGLHKRLAPLLHPEAPSAAQLFIRYINELGGDRPHFHEYIRGFPGKGLLGITTLDRVGFEYVAGQAGVRVMYEGDAPRDALAVLPTYL